MNPLFGAVGVEHGLFGQIPEGKTELGDLQVRNFVDQDDILFLVLIRGSEGHRQAVAPGINGHFFGLFFLGATLMFLVHGYWILWVEGFQRWRKGHGDGPQLIKRAGAEDLLVGIVVEAVCEVGVIVHQRQEDL